MGEIVTNLLQQRVTEQACEQRMIRDAALVKKFRKMPNPLSPRNDKLVHNLSSKEMTEDQLQVLRHEASFNTTDAKPVNMIAAVESVLCQTEATEETKSLIRHQVSSLLMAHRPREVLFKVERDALRELKADKDLVIVPADKGRSTVVLDRTDYLQKAKGTPTYGLAKWLFRRLKFLTAELDTTVSSSAQSLEKLKGDLAIETIELLHHSKYDETENPLGHSQIRQLLKLCLRTYFIFDVIVYEQVKGTPIGRTCPAYVVDQFFKEVALLNRVGRHPNIVPMLGMVKQSGLDGLPLIVLEYVDGPNLVDYPRSKLSDARSSGSGNNIPLIQCDLFGRLFVADLFAIAVDVANAMARLASLGVCRLALY
ncbi:hypothetical protein SprV_0200538900 [Sparganum proliferum]